MTIEYKIRLFDQLNSDTYTAEVNDFESLFYRRVVNGIDTCVFELDGDHRAIDSLIYDHESATGGDTPVLMEVWRRNKKYDIDWSREFNGWFQDEAREFVRGRKVFTGTAFGLNYALAYRIVNWYANQTDRTKFISKSAEYIMKNIVRYNATGAATVAGGRKSEGDTFPTNLYFSASFPEPWTRGNTLDWYCFGDNVLETLQKLAFVGGGDFDIRFKEDEGHSRPEFEFYPGQLGTDRSSTVTFSLLRGNMGNPKYVRNRSREKTLAAVWAQGEGASRIYETVTLDDYYGDNSKEVFVDARDLESGLTERGEERLRKTKSPDIFTFDVIQTPASLYGKHYFLGDIVTAEWEDISKTLKVNEVTVDVSQTGDKREKISIGINNRYE